MALDEIRDMVAHNIAMQTVDGGPLATHMHAYGLDLGLDVDAIIASPDAHIIPQERLSHG